MIAIDTNVLVRLLTGDDPAQTKLAAALFESGDILIPKTVLLETEWVLRYSYELTPDVVLSAFRKILGLAQVKVEDAPAVVAALASYEDGMDFADALHLASATKAEAFATFDARLKKRAGRQANVKLL
jgi:predicted nucleic-acid-binding protein